MPKVFTSKSQRTKELGRRVAMQYLKNKGFTLIESKYPQELRGLDIIAKKGRVLHFIELKSKSVIDFSGIRKNTRILKGNTKRAKIEKLKGAIQTYLVSRGIFSTWQFDSVLVYLSDTQKRARIEIKKDL